jgi:hypothetical protein
MTLSKPLETIDQILNDRDIFGKVETPVTLIKEIYSLLVPPPNLSVYEPGVGTNIFQQHYPTFCKYSGCEIKPTCDLPSNIFIGDFFDQKLETYDLILGNPPFRVESTVPSTSPIPKKPIQKTIWPDIVKRCWNHLKPDGKMAFILPCIWLKPDKAGIYDLFTSHRILFLRTFDCVESNKLFHYKGQTPCCYVIVQKSPPLETFKIHDGDRFIDFKLKPGLCIPTKNADLLQKSLSKFSEPLKVIKISSTVPEGEVIDNPQLNYPIILGASLVEGQLIFNGIESEIPGLFQGTPKIILAHKRLPIPFLDLDGIYGVHGRDKYVILGTDEELKKIYAFLFREETQTIIKSFTIRMNYYEKYVFDYLPSVNEIV